jgi:hypothetical protein
MIRRPAPAANNSDRTVYLLRIQRTRPSGDERDLRWLLKRLLRTYGFRCVAIEKETQQ